MELDSGEYLVECTFLVPKIPLTKKIKNRIATNENKRLMLPSNEDLIFSYLLVIGRQSMMAHHDILILRAWIHPVHTRKVVYGPQYVLTTFLGMIVYFLQKYYIL